MSQRYLTIFVVALCVTLISCAKGYVFVSPDEAHAKITASVNNPGAHLYPVTIRKVDDYGAYGRNAIWIAPGEHTFRIAADFESMSRNESGPISDLHFTGEERVKNFTATVEAGKSYTLSARYIGPKLEDWEPVLVLVE